MTGEVSGAVTSTHDSGHSTGVRSARKRKAVKRGTYNSLTRLCRGFCSKSYNVHHTCASHAPWIIQPDLQKTKYHNLSDHVFVAPVDPVPEGTVTGEVCGAAASTRDSGHSTGVRSAQKRKSVEQGTYNSLT